MAAPTPTPRTTPTGFKMPDGYQTLITFGKDASIQLWEKQVKPPGMDGGEKIDTSTMHNVKYRTFDARSLITLTDSSFKAAYDPDALPNVRAAINRHDTITVRYPDGSSDAFYGFLQKAEQPEFTEGTMPELDCMITPTNWDYVNGVEAAPVFTPAAGT